MGNSLSAESKLMYYPTSEFETHRLLALLGRVSIEDYKKNIIREQVLGQEKYRELFCIAADNNIRMDNVLYDYFLKQKEYKLIKEYFELEIGYNQSDNKVVTIADLFAGEGKWLDSFSDVMYRSSMSNLYIQIANELDEDRFSYINSNDNIDDKYNKAFEELQLPKNSISLMLFNPPYGSTNGVRNVRHYLKMILDRKLLYNPEETKDYKTGYMVFVIRKDDFLDSLDILTQYFDINEHCIYKVHEEEYSKFKQYIFIGHVKRFPYDMTKTQDAVDYQNKYNKVKTIIESEPEFNWRMYNTYQMMNYPYVDYDSAKENFKYVDNQFKYISKQDNVWNWIQDMTELKDLSTENIVMPKNPKIGEISLLLASGMINGNIELDNNTARHIVVGGTKTVQKQEIETSLDSDGKKVHTTKTIKFSKPYLNILCNHNGKLTIKELGEAETE